MEPGAVLGDWRAGPPEAPWATAAVGSGAARRGASGGWGAFAERFRVPDKLINYREN